MKKLISFFLCLTMLFCLFSMVTVANASTAYLGDGGQVLNSGCDRAVGRTSGGVDGYIYVTCAITVADGGLFTKDSVTATMTTDVRAVNSAYMSITAYYTRTSGIETSSNNTSSSTVPDSGLSVTATAGNDHLYKGTAGYRIDSSNRGTWICGTIIEI